MYLVCILLGIRLIKKGGIAIEQDNPFLKWKTLGCNTDPIE